jgi:hypothetical protein
MHFVLGTIKKQQQQQQHQTDSWNVFLVLCTSNVQPTHRQTC